MNEIECVIRAHSKEDKVYYFIVPSSSLGITAKTSSLIEYAASDEMWSQIKKYSDENHRLLVTLEEPFEGLCPCRVKAIKVIEHR